VTPGMATIVVRWPSQELDRSPMVSSERDTPALPSQSASAEDIFMGCWSYISFAC